jgi:Protein of unknown function (DUF1592)/Protein of unknown function (DUF1588)/Protein of unknown function (DUF1595)/Protein of unknown function (DUF1585)/Protein of unknown function (DUF1587)
VSYPTTMPHCFRHAPLLFAVTVWGCTGTIGDTSGGHPGTFGGSTTSPGRTTAGPELQDQPGLMPLRRLTRSELGNTLRDLLGESTTVVEALPPDSVGVSGFQEAGVVSAVDVDHLVDLAERVGKNVAARLPALLACDPAVTGEDACARQFFVKFGRRAYRRPLAESEIANLVAYVKDVRAKLTYSFAEAMRVAVQAMLLSPSFLYRWELGPLAARGEPGGLVRLDADETAARLSFFLWGSMPDDALFDAVDRNQLATTDDVLREGRRMLSDPRAQQSVASFHSQWLGLDRLVDEQKDSKQFPEWNPSLAGAMLEETAAFAIGTVLEGDGRLSTLLSSSTSYVNADLARLYGVNGVTSQTLVLQALDPAQRAGLFTHASFLASHATPTSSHPVKRGKKIFSDVLCGTIPPPPAMVPPTETPSPNVSTRERFVAHEQNQCAKACHSLMDPPGFAFEHYDAVGRYRTMDGGKPVDSSGLFVGPSGGDPIAFNDAIEFMNILAASDDVRRCVTNRWFRYAVGRADVPGDEASLETAYDAFVKSEYNVRELMVGVAGSRSFQYRTPAEGEVLQ